jgi:hypothetical protein
MRERERHIQQEEVIFTLNTVSGQTLTQDFIAFPVLPSD